MKDNFSTDEKGALRDARNAKHYADLGRFIMLRIHMRSSSACEIVAYCRIPLLLLSCVLGATESGCRMDESAPPEVATKSLSVVVNDQYLPTLNTLLDGAKKTISVVHFELNADADGDDIVKRLGAAASRGVDVQVLLENSVADNAQRVTTLADSSVKARLDVDARYTHAKLVVVDGAQALFGSTNLSAQSMRWNNEANLFSTDIQIAGWFQLYANRLMADSAVTPEHTATETELGIPLQDGDYPSRASTLIDGAKRDIALLVYGMNADPKYPDSDVNQLIRKLGAAQRRGVHARVVLEIASSDLGVNDVNRQAAQVLRGEGIEVRFDSPDQITHAKVLLVDDTAIVGSNNWGYGGFHTYHEVGMQTRAADVNAKLRDYFEGIWGQGSAP